MNLNRTEQHQVDRVIEMLNMKIKFPDARGFDTRFKENPLRREWEIFVSKYDIKLLWTLTFIDPSLRCEFSNPGDREKALFNSKILNDGKVIAIAEELIKRISQRLYGRSKTRQLEGFGCIEYQECGQPHFHFLVTSDVDLDTFSEAMRKVLDGAERKARAGKTKERLLNVRTNAIFKRYNAQAESTSSVEGKAMKLLSEYEETRKLRNVKNAFAWVDRKNLDIKEGS
jgi:hypothetical protein